MSRFRLDVVLRLRELAEDSARARLAAALAAHARALVLLHARHEDASTERNRQIGVVREAAIRPARAGALVDAAAAAEHAERAVAAAEAGLGAAAADLLDARQAMSEASRRREVVERLRGRIRAAELRAADRRLEAELNEIASVRHGRTAFDRVPR